MKTSDTQILCESYFSLHSEHIGCTVIILRLFSHASFSLRLDKRPNRRFQKHSSLFLITNFHARAQILFHFTAFH